MAHGADDLIAMPQGSTDCYNLIGTSNDKKSLQILQNCCHELVSDNENIIAEFVNFINTNISSNDNNDATVTALGAVGVAIEIKDKGTARRLVLDSQ